jgi:hypothetical protein
MRNKNGTNLRISKSVPKTIRGLKTRLSSDQKKALAKMKNVNVRFIRYVLNGERADTIGLFDAGVELIQKELQNQ